MASFAYLLRLKTALGDINILNDSLGASTLAAALQGDNETGISLEDTMKVKQLLEEKDLSAYALKSELQAAVSNFNNRIAQLSNAMVGYFTKRIAAADVLAPTADIPFAHALIEHSLKSIVAGESWDADGDNTVLPIKVVAPGQVAVNLTTIDPLENDRYLDVILLGKAFESVEIAEEPSAPINGVAFDGGSARLLADGSAEFTRADGTTFIDGTLIELFNWDGKLYGKNSGGVTYRRDSLTDSWQAEQIQAYEAHREMVPLILTPPAA